MIERQGERFVVKGAVNLYNVLEVLRAGERLFDGEKVIVDFSGATEVDSSAVSLMLEWTRWARNRGARIVFINLGESISSLTNLYGVEALLPVGAE